MDKRTLGTRAMAIVTLTSEADSYRLADVRELRDAIAAVIDNCVCRDQKVKGCPSCEAIATIRRIVGGSNG